MRVMFGATAQRRERLAEAALWWDRKGVERETLLLSDGTAGYLDAVAPAAPDLAVMGGVPVRRTANGTVYLVAQADPDRTAAALAEIARRGPATVMLATGSVRTHDGGAGLLAALAGRPDLAATGALPITGADAVAPSGTSPVDLLAAARSAVAGLSLVAAVEDDVPLLGLDGMSARLRERGVDPGEAQRAEREIGEFAHAMIAAARELDGRRSLGAPNLQLLAGGDQPPYAVPGSGSGGGTAHAVRLLGGRILPAIDVVADAVGTELWIGKADLVVAIVGALNAHELTGGVVAALARRAARWAVPLVVLTDDEQVGRREWSAAGIAGVYEWGADPAALVARVARTWDLG